MAAQTDREAVEVSHSVLHATYDRSATERAIAGALRSAIDAHGSIDRRNIGSATKRIVKQLTAPDGRPGCPYCQERLRVNVALLMENKELRGRLAGRPSEEGEGPQ